MVESAGTGSHGSAVWFSEEHKPRQRYLVVGHSSKGLELPEIRSDSGEAILPVFSSEEAAWEYLSFSSLGTNWYVRGFSGGELVSVLFAFHTRIRGVLLDPHSSDLSGEVAVSVVGRNAFVSTLLETPSHHPAFGARS